MRSPVFFLALLVATLSTPFAAADSMSFTTVRFTYRGSGDEIVSSGHGFFTFPTGLKTVSLQDLTSFYFFQSTLFYAGDIRSDFVYGLSKLTDFTAVITGSRFTSSLSLNTIAVQGTDPRSLPELFHVTALRVDGGAYTAIPPHNVLTTGTVMLSPEPTSLLLVATGLLGIVGNLLCTRRAYNQKSTKSFSTRRCEMTGTLKSGV